MLPEHLETNKLSWNNKVSYHIESDFYNQGEFMAGKSSLKEPELKLFGEVAGKSILHLQCHFGQDSISLARMGAKVTGIDLSDKAVAAGKKIAAELGVDSDFVCSDVYSLKENLQGKFDIVFTSYGAICWLPDLDRWADIVSHFLDPGGRVVMAEFHPVLMMYDDDFKSPDFGYFNSGPIVEELSGTYADPSAPLTQEYITWNHSLSDVISALISHGLTIDQFHELDYSPYNFLKQMHEDEHGKFRIKGMERQIPLVYGLSAVKS